MFKIPFSGVREVNDLVQFRGLEMFEDFPEHIPNRIMLATLLKRSPLQPRPNHTKDALYSTRGWGKKSKYYTSCRRRKLPQSLLC